MLRRWMWQDLSQHCICFCDQRGLHDIPLMIVNIGWVGFKKAFNPNHQYCDLTTLSEFDSEYGIIDIASNHYLLDDRSFPPCHFTRLWFSD